VARESQAGYYDTPQEQPRNFSIWNISKKLISAVKNVFTFMPLIAIFICNSWINIAVDTGAEVNILDEETFNKLPSKPTLLKPVHSLHAYGNKEPIPQRGRFKTRVLYNGQYANLEFIVTCGNHGNLLSYESAVALGVIARILTVNAQNKPASHPHKHDDKPPKGHSHKSTKSSHSPAGSAMPNTFEQQRFTNTKQSGEGNSHNNAPTKDKTTPSSTPPVLDPTTQYYKVKYPFLFSGRVGLLKDYEVVLHLDETVRPVQQRLRPVPIHLQAAVERELTYMLEQDVIEPVSGPTPWISPIVPVPKPNTPGEIRICSDNRCSNRAIKPCRHTFPTLDDVAVWLNGAAVISCLDLKSSFQQLLINEESRHVTTFCTHLGLFRYKRLNFGINTASHELQRALEKVLIGLPGTFNLADDILVFGRDQTEHDQRLEAVLNRLNEVGLTLNETKCRLSKTELDFFGLHVSAKGISIQDRKHKALLEAGPPKNPSELRSLLGLASYCSRFIPDLATIVEPLRALTHKTAKWEWGQCQDDALLHLKRAIMKTTLAYFNKKWRTELTVDASPVGLAAVMAQHDPAKPNEKHIIINISRALSPVERRYAQIEREALAIVWACERLHFFLYAREFDLYTDNKPVQLIFQNDTSKPKARIERWALRLLPYRFKVHHIDGDGNIADYMSRNPVEEELGLDDNELIAERYINMISETSRPAAVSRNDIIKATASDATLQRVAAMTNGGPPVEHFNQDAHELTMTTDGILMRGNRIVVPASLQHQFIRIAHSGHMGLVKTKQLLRQHVYFPHMDNMVEQAIRTCNECQLNTKLRQATPCQVSEMPSGPWENLSIDFYGPLPSGKYLLVVLDDYSRYPVCRMTSSTGADKVIPLLNEIFAEFSIPLKLKSDNGPPFNSAKFAQFAKNQGFWHQKITPLWPQANGHVERFMRSMGKVLRNASATAASFESELCEFLRNYRATPHSSTQVPPRVLLFQGRTTTTRLPAAPAPIDLEQAHTTANNNHQKSQLYNKNYNDEKRRAKPSTIKVGDFVLLLATRSHKSDPWYEKEPYEVIALNGTMATIKNNRRELARNVSFLKHWLPDPHWPEVEQQQRQQQPQPQTPVQQQPQPQAPVQQQQQQELDAPGEAQNQASGTATAPLVPPPLLLHGPAAGASSGLDGDGEDGSDNNESDNYDEQSDADNLDDLDESETRAENFERSPSARPKRNCNKPERYGSWSSNVKSRAAASTPAKKRGPGRPPKTL
jgi:transposase InsO family protein